MKRKLSFKKIAVSNLSTDLVKQTCNGNNAGAYKNDDRLYCCVGSVPDTAVAPSIHIWTYSGLNASNVIY